MDFHTKKLHLFQIIDLYKKVATDGGEQIQLL